MSLVGVIVTTDFTIPTTSPDTPPIFTYVNTTQGDPEPAAGYGSIIGTFSGILVILVIIIVILVIVVLVQRR